MSRGFRRGRRNRGQVRLVRMGESYGKPTHGNASFKVVYGGHQPQGLFRIGMAREARRIFIFLGIAVTLAAGIALGLSWNRMEDAARRVVYKFLIESPANSLAAEEFQETGNQIRAGAFQGALDQVMSGQTLGGALSYFHVSMMDVSSRALGLAEGRLLPVKHMEEGTPAPEGAKEDDEILIVLDPGHGGVDDGCIREGIKEKEINLAIALSLRDLLVEMDYQVLMTREEDSYLSLEDRVTLANDYGADIFVSIHQNAYEDEAVCGIETWFDGEAENAEDRRRLARLIHGQALDAGDAADREIRADSAYYVTRHTRMPSCLIETGFLSNKEEREALGSAKYQDRLARGIAQGIELYFHPKTMYLTFDDGPSRENTTKVLDLLKEAGIHATFFVVGENVRRFPEIARRIVEEGHTIGIHCNVHIYEQIYASVESYVEDFQAAYDAVYEATGVEPWLFRFPGGSINSYNKEVYEDIIAEMTERGYVYFDWNASLEDAARGTTPELLLSNAKNTTLGRRKVVMLAHDIVDNTVQCLPRLLDSFPEYRMKPLTEEVTPIQF